MENENQADPNKKQRISLSLRKTRQKKQVADSSQQKDLNQNLDDLKHKSEIHDKPFVSTYHVKGSKQYQDDFLDRVELLPDLACSLKQKNTVQCVKLEDLDNDKATALDQSLKYKVSSSRVSSTLTSEESNVLRPTRTDTIKIEQNCPVSNKHEYPRKEEAASLNTVKRGAKEKASSSNTIKYEAKEETYHFNTIKHETKEKAHNNKPIKHELEEEYNCPICNIGLAYITSTEFRQKHVEDCISSAQYVEQVFDGCVICNQELSYLDLNQKQKHINRCLDGPTATRYNNSSDDFAAPIFVYRNNQKILKPTRADDKHDELYQATLAMSKSLQKPDKKVKIEMNEANIWSDHKSRQEASQNLCQLLDAKNEVAMARQSEREVSIGYLDSSSVYTLPTLLSCHSLPVNFWEIAGLQDVNPLLLTSSFLRANNHAPH